MNDATIYLPATKHRDAQPAPELLTDREALRLLRLRRKAGEAALARLRDNGLPYVVIGGECKYPTRKVLAWAMERRPDHKAEMAGRALRLRK